MDDNIGIALETTKAVTTSVQSLLEKWNTVAKQFGFVMTALNAIAEIHPHAKAVWSVISFIPRAISNQIKLDKDIMELLDEIRQSLHLAPDDEPLDTAMLRSRCEQSRNRKKTVEQLIDLITACGLFIQSYAEDVKLWKRLAKNLISNKAEDIATFRQQLRKLHDAFIDETIVDVDINVQRILANVESIGERLEDHDLDTKFPFVPGTRFNPEKGCLEGTRVTFLQAITDWVNDVDPSSPMVLMLFGQAGSGKSSIAHEIAKKFDDAGCLATSYCFIRDVTSRETYKFFTTLARNLCSRYPAFKAALDTIIRKKPDVLAATDFTTLFKSLIVDPLEGLQPVSPVLIVIDALDESEDANRRSPHTFHTFLGKHIDQLPSNFRILMTSRPEPGIMEAFPISSYVRQMSMDDRQLAHPGEVDNDIYRYMRTMLWEAGVENNVLHRLARKAEGLFQWAFVACSYIAEPPPGLEQKDCIERVLHPTGGKESLDAIYLTILERFKMDDPYIGDNFRSIMGQVLGVFEPLSIAALNIMRQCNPDQSGRTNVSSVVKHMGSLLSNVTPNSENPISPLHTSFRDFLTNPDRSGKFCVNLDAARAQLAYATVETMRAMLHFNICKLSTSYCLNSEVPDLEERITNHIPSALSYSCRFWAKHLAYAFGTEAELFRCLQVFIEEKLLFWLEVLSVRKEVPIASTALLLLRAWLGRIRDKIQTEQVDGLDALVKDAVAFIRYFGYPIAQSTPHIYISALPFAPLTSVIAQRYSALFPHSLRVERGRLTQWPAVEMTISVPPYRGRRNVGCIAWSSDGERIAAGTEHGRIFIWNASIGTTVSGPFGIDDESVSSIAFSHDGLCLASGSLYGKIRIWEVMTGKEAVGKGKSRAFDYWGAVLALSFSQDGKRLVFGSADCTVRVWDIEKGEVVVGPFEGHNNPVWAVSFMADQEHIASRSGFRTVLVWNVQTRKRLMTPSGFEDMIISNGTINTASLEYDSELGFECNAFEIKSNFVTCSQSEAEDEKSYDGQQGRSEYRRPISDFSPDGRLVATCDATQIHTWYANGELAGKLAGGPFSNEGVMCLAFSEDGQRIVSGSKDGTVQTWSLGIVDEDESKSAKRGDLYSVTFTDGEQIVVGRRGEEIQLLDATTGQEIVTIGESRSLVGLPAAAVSQNGDLIAWATWNAMNVSTRTGDTAASPLKSDGEIISVISFSATLNDLVAFGTQRGTVYLWNARTEALIAGPKKICAWRVTSLALCCSNADSAQTDIVVGSLRKVFIWDTFSGNVRGPFSHHEADVGALVISDNGRYVTSAAIDYTLCVWDPADGKLVRGPVRWSGNQNYTPSVALTQNGQRVAFVGKDHIILVFDVLYINDRDITLQGPWTLAGHSNGVRDMSFSRNGRLLATISWDFTGRIWNVQDAAERSHALINLASDKVAVNWDGAVIDDDGWLTCNSGGSPLRLIWTHSLHRKSFHRPSNVCVVGHEGLETRLDLDSYYAHGRDWIKCYEGYEALVSSSRGHPKGDLGC